MSITFSQPFNRSTGINVHYVFEENLNIVSTTSTTYQTYLSLSTGDLQKGIYRVGFCIETERDDFLDNINWRFRRDDVEDLYSLVDGSYSQTFYQPLSMEFVLPIYDELSHTFSIDFRKQSGPSFVQINQANIMFWRIS